MGRSKGWARSRLDYSRCGRRDGQRSISGAGSGSFGGESPRACRARRRLSRAVCRRRWGRGGSATVVACRRSAWPNPRVTLSSAEREKIAIHTAQDCGVRKIARRLSRHPSTISRKLQRNAATRCGKLDYRARTAQWKARAGGATTQGCQACHERPSPCLCARALAGAIKDADSSDGRCQMSNRLGAD